MSGEMLKTCSTKYGLIPKRTTPPIIPKIACTVTAVHTRGVTFSCSPLPRASATNLVVALPKPKSNIEKDPKNTHAKERSPNRSVPSPRTTKGMEITATSRGSAWPIRLMSELRAISSPLILTARLSFLVSSSPDVLLHPIPYKLLQYSWCLPDTTEGLGCSSAGSFRRPP